MEIAVRANLDTLYFYTYVVAYRWWQYCSLRDTDLYAANHQLKIRTTCVY